MRGCVIFNYRPPVKAPIRATKDTRQKPDPETRSHATEFQTPNVQQLASLQRRSKASPTTRHLSKLQHAANVAGGKPSVLQLRKIPNDEVLHTDVEEAQATSGSPVTLLQVLQKIADDFDVDHAGLSEAELIASLIDDKALDPEDVSFLQLKVEATARAHDTADQRDQRRHDVIDRTADADRGHHESRMMREATEGLSNSHKKGLEKPSNNSRHAKAVGARKTAFTKMVAPGWQKSKTTEATQRATPLRFSGRRI